MLKAFFPILGMEPRLPHMLGKCSPAKPRPQPYNCYYPKSSLELVEEADKAPSK